MNCKLITANAKGNQKRYMEVLPDLWQAVYPQHHRMFMAKDWVLLHDSTSVSACMCSSNLLSLVLWCFPTHHIFLISHYMFISVCG